MAWKKSGPRPNLIADPCYTILYVRVSDLFVDFACRRSCVLQVGGAAVGESDAAAGGNPTDGKIHTAEPAGVVIHSTAV